MKRSMGVGAVLGMLPCALFAAQVATKDFARKAEFVSAKISPNGEYLAVTAPVDDQTALAVLDVRTRKVTGTLRFVRNEHVHEFWWVSPTRLVVSIANRGGPLDQPRLTGELYGVNADGSRANYLFGYRGREQVGTRIRNGEAEAAWAFMLDPLVKDPKHALIAVVPWGHEDFQNPTLERLDVDTGARSHSIYLPVYPPIDVAADETGEPRIASGTDEKSNAVLFVRSANEAWKPVAYPGGPPESFRVYAVTPGGRSAFLAATESGGRSCIREYHFDSAQLTEIYCSEAELEPVLSSDFSRVIAVSLEKAKTEYVILDREHPDSRLLQSLLKTFPGQEIHTTSWTADGGKVVWRVKSDTNPGDFYLFDRSARKAEYLLSRRGWIDPKAMTRVEPVEYGARDGYRIAAYLTAAQGLATRNAPLVVMPHGGPHGIRDRWEWDDWAQFLASRGYAVLQPNFRGSDGYGAPHEKAGYGKWGTRMIDDITDGARWAVAQGIADPARLCIVGASYGGYAALMSVVREPEVYRCAASFAGVYDLATQFKDSDTAETLMGRHYLKRVMGDDEKVLAEQSPVTYVEKLKAAVLIAHGTADKRVPFSQAKELRKALDRQNKPYEWLEYPGEEHGFYVDANHEDFLDKLADFLDRQIGDRRAAVPAAAPKP